MTSNAPYTGIPNRFRQTLLARRRLIGCWCSLANPVTTEVLGLAGFDWLLLDAGFYNFLIPYVESAEEARRAVAATRYPPAGVRGVSVSQRQNRYGTVPDFLKSINENIALMVQIESAVGLAAVDAIAAVEGVDGIFVGPSDLAAAMGHLGNAAHPEVQQAIRHIFERARAAGKASGILAPVEADARRYMEWGAEFVAVGSDLGLFRSATQALRDKFAASA